MARGQLVHLDADDGGDAEAVERAADEAARELRVQRAVLLRGVLPRRVRRAAREQLQLVVEEHVDAAVVRLQLVDLLAVDLVPESGGGGGQRTAPNCAAKLRGAHQKSLQMNLVLLRKK